MNDNEAYRRRYSHPGLSGRKPKASTLVKRALALVDKHLPDIFEALIKKAVEEGDREAQMYLIDRRLGKPKQQAELEVSGEVSVETLVRLLGMIQQRRITGGTDAIQRQIEGQGSSQGTNEKEA